MLSNERMSEALNILCELIFYQHLSPKASSPFYVPHPTLRLCTKQERYTFCFKPTSFFSLPSLHILTACALSIFQQKCIFLLMGLQMQTFPL